MTWLLTLWTRLKVYAVSLGVVLVAIGSAWLYGRHSGKSDQKQADDDKQANANTIAEKQITQAQESRHATDAEVQALPAAPVQTAETAATDTAAGQLRDDWMRD